MALSKSISQKTLRIELNLLRDYLRGEDTRDLSTLQTAVEDILAKLDNPLDPVVVEDTGVNTNPERWLHENHWEPLAEVTITVAGAGGEQDLGVVVPADTHRRIREMTIRHAGTNPTVVTLLISGGATKVSIDIPAGVTRQWSNQDGKSFDPTEQSAAQSSDVTGGNTYVSATGVESSPPPPEDAVRSFIPEGEIGRTIANLYAKLINGEPKLEVGYNE